MRRVIKPRANPAADPLGVLFVDRSVCRTPPNLLSHPLPTFFSCLFAAFWALPSFAQENVGSERFPTPLVKPDPTVYDSTVPTPLDRIKSFSRLGPVDIRPHFGYLALYNDNIYIQKNDPVDDFEHVISPGIFLGAWNYLSRDGLYLQADYTPSILLFTEHPETDTVDHRASLGVGRTFRRAAISLSQTFEKTSDPTVEGGGRLARKIYNTALSGSYNLTDKTSFEANIYQIFNDYETQISTREWANMNWLNYQMFPKIALAAGAGGGYVQAAPSPDAVYEKMEGRVTYEPTAKMTYVLHGGLEFRQFQGSQAAPDLISPIFGMEARYQPFDATLISFRAKREVRPSNLFGNQVSVNTGFNALVRQRFFQKYFVSVNGGYENAEYQATVKSQETQGKFDYYFFRTDFAYEIKTRANISLYYQFQDNVSNQDLNTYQNNQVGLGFTLRF